MLLASFFYGFFTTQMAGGILAPIIGGARLVGLAMMIASILTLFSPMVAYSGFIPIISLRSILGMIQVHYPASLNLKITKMFNTDYDYFCITINFMIRVWCSRRYTNCGVTGHLLWSRQRYWRLLTRGRMSEPFAAWHFAEL